MNQEQYFEISKTNNLPLRCPILNYCSRRAYTIYFNSDYGKSDPENNVVKALQKDGTLSSDFEKNKIELQGEGPTWIGGNNNFYFKDMCPEVNLFDSSNSLFQNTACVEGDYDSYREKDKKRVIKCQHFSICPEFNKFMFEKSQTIKSNSKKRRPAIPQKTKALLQKEIKSKCPICPSEDVEHFQIHHIDENPENNNFENLLMLCPTCHSKITKKDISEEEVIEYKDNLRI
ncbi:HNH endonuclease [Flavobacterium sp. 5]|uniref:HNH endonuclease n=1 Tax=Flavobacterium sp. 5 TaxID=2035199 RepID=UPI000CAAD392|nr:HNH endonuclease [Flavobacterium sp. 5]PKB15222.1 HNH endonuclease [Flavobacterium sp. 5]